MTTQEKPRTEVTLTRLVATALAAITAAFLGSRLGMAGTVIGAGVASIVSTVAGALYQHSLDRTSNRLRSRVTQSHERIETDRPPADIPRRRLNWRMVAAVTVAAFVIGMGAITGYELLTHGPISGGGNGTTISNLFGRQPAGHPPAPNQPSAPTSVTTTTQSPPTTTTTQAPTPTTTPPPTTTTPPSTTSGETPVPTTTTANRAE